MFLSLRTVELKWLHASQDQMNERRSKRRKRQMTTLLPGKNIVKKNMLDLYGILEIILKYT